MSESIVEKVAATIAVPDLIRHAKTWGDWEEWQREPYRRDARAVLRVVAEFIDAPSVMGDTGVIYVCRACGDPIETEPCREHMPIAYAAMGMSDLSDALLPLAHENDLYCPRTCTTCYPKPTDREDDRG